RYKIEGGATKTIFLRLSNKIMDKPFPTGVLQIFKERKEEADNFYASIFPSGIAPELAQIQRQALAGLFGASNIIIMMWKDGLRAQMALLLQARPNYTGAITTGNI